MDGLSFCELANNVKHYELNFECICNNCGLMRLLRGV
uniref:Uncharacterized protein n=1 Tax=Setaria italica TaxID=4555 RepID=K3YFE6_SETIT